VKKYFFALSLAVFAAQFYSCVSDGTYTLALPESSESDLVKQSSNSEEISSSSDNTVSSSSDNTVSSSSDNAVSSSSVSSSSGTACATWGNWVEETPATCEKEGAETRTCTSGNSNPETRPIDKLEWGEWEIKTPATQTTLAKGKRTCPNGEIDEQDLAICGADTPFAPEEQFCQYGTNKVLELCGSAIYNAMQFCQSPGVLKLLCGSKTYAATQFCQSSDVVEDLCGSKIYTAKQFCQSSDVVKDLCGTATYTATEFCQSGTNEVKPLCGGKTYTQIQSCQENVVVQIETCGSEQYNSLAQFCYNGSKVGNLCGNNPQKSYDPDLYECKAGKNGIYLKNKLSDGTKTYDAVLIGTHVWMAENYAGGNGKCGDDEYELKDENTAICYTYGRLYDWSTANSVCPSGWHLPTAAEWTTLANYVGSYAGTKLKEASGWTSAVIAGTDDYGFAALPGGYGYTDEGFDNDVVGYTGYWWSATTYGTDNAYLRFMEYNNSLVRTGASNKSYLLSVRCIRAN